MTTPNRIFHLLDILNIDQKDFADEIGLTDKTVSKWKTSRLGLVLKMEMHSAISTKWQ